MISSLFLKLLYFSGIFQESLQWFEYNRKAFSIFIVQLFNDDGYCYSPSASILCYTDERHTFINDMLCLRK
jgi:hypothetical protein